MDIVTVVEPRLERAKRLNTTVERGVAVFMEVGIALVQIKADKLFVELGYRTFDEYCWQEHGLGHSRRAQLMVAATVAENLLGDSTMVELPQPVNERQVRPLAALDTAGDQRVAWAAAVDAAGGEQPTSTLVAEVVEHLKNPSPLSAEPSPGGQSGHQEVQRPERPGGDPKPAARARKQFDRLVLSLNTNFVVRYADFTHLLERVTDDQLSSALSGVDEAIDAMVDLYDFRRAIVVEKDRRELLNEQLRREG